VFGGHLIEEEESVSIAAEQTDLVVSGGTAQEIILSVFVGFHRGFITTVEVEEFDAGVVHGFAVFVLAGAADDDGVLGGGTEGEQGHEGGHEQKECDALGHSPHHKPPASGELCWVSMNSIATPARGRAAPGKGWDRVSPRLQRRAA